jgi:Bifunctional DNA primase/polymerase, N-terminal
MHPAITSRDQHRQDGKLRNPAWPPLLDAALHYATLNLPVFPCVPRGKNPAVARGFYSATTNPETIRRFWSVRDRNVAIPTGAISGFWVLDIDPDHCGDASIDALQAKHGMLPPTREVITGGGGRHLWFRYTGSIQSSEGRVAPGIDVRGDGGYVVAPPSIHQNGRAYAWVTPDFAEPAIAPGWLVALTRKGGPIHLRARRGEPASAPQPLRRLRRGGAQWRDRGARRGRAGDTQRCSEPRHLSALSARRRRRA